MRRYIYISIFLASALTTPQICLSHESIKALTQAEIDNMKDEIKKLSAKIASLSEQLKISDHHHDAQDKDNKSDQNEETQKIDADKALDDFKAAYFLFKNHQYQEAKEEFQNFITAHSEHSLVGSAHYWIGEIYSKMGEYKNAASQYLKGYKSFESGGRAPDNLLKLSESLLKMGQPEQACISLKKLKSQFPDASDAIKTQANEVMQAANCG